MRPAEPGGGGFRLLRSLTFRLALFYLAIFIVSVAVLIAIL